MEVPMGKVRFLCLFAIPVFTVISVSCSSSGGLKSVAITPATADAQTSPNGQVQFTAMGSYSGQMQSVAVKALWWTSQPWVIAPTAAPTPAPGITVDSNGLASCTNLTGTFTLWATAPKDQSTSVSQMSKNTPQVSATAQMTCP